MKKEPIQYPWIWVVLVIIVLLSVPWYLPDTAVYPLIFGFPLWAVIAIVMSIILSAFLSFVLKNYWAEDEEEEEDDQWSN